MMQASVAYVELGRSPLELVDPVGSGSLGVLHPAWALGRRWPGGTGEARAERLSGSTELPSTALAVHAPEPAILGLGITGSHRHTAREEVQS
jgi:hypothetical protein